MSDQCLRLKRMFLSRWLCEPPAVPELRVSSTCSTVVATFRYDAPTPYNVDDRFELQVLPTQPEIVKALGDALAWVTLYEGRDRVFTLDKLPAERSFRVRGRAFNSRARSAWSAELDIATRQVPTGCGGKGPGYTWDQTPEAVELRLPLPVGTASREVRVEVLPLRIRVAVRGAVLLEGRLGGQVRAADTGDFEWEVAGDQLVVTMQKRDVSYDPNAQWCCLIDGPGHPKIDCARLSWTRTDRPWRPPQDARTLEEVASALPDNTVLSQPTNTLPASGDDMQTWGKQWTPPVRHRDG